MKAAWYENQGPASEVLITGTTRPPEPKTGEVRIRVAASGINPGDVKKRQDAFSVGMPHSRVIPHSDGAGTIDRVGPGVPKSRVGERVWCYGAQSSRPFGTAAEYVVVPSPQAISLPGTISMEQGACLGIPGITAHRAVDVAGSVKGRTVLVQGGGGAVGQCAIALARQAGARVIATVRSKQDEEVAQRAGAHNVVRTDGISDDEAMDGIQRLAPDGIHHVVEVAFGANIKMDVEGLAQGGSIAAYATAMTSPSIPFWNLAFKNVRVFFLGSDDFPAEAKTMASRAMNEALEAGWPGFTIGKRFPLESIALAHEAVEQGEGTGRVVIVL